MIRAARLAEREPLEELQRRASVHSSTYRGQLVAHPDAVALPAEQIERGLVRVAERGGEVVGFAVLLDAVAGGCELDGLFVEPARWRAGIGSALIEDAVRIAHAQGAERIDVIANPDATPFYQRVGFAEGAEVATRFGPARRMRLELDGG